MKKLLTFVFVFFLLTSTLSFVSSEGQALQPQKQGQCVNLLQTHANSTYMNLTRVITPAPASRIINLGVYMSKSGPSYNYSFCDTSQIGQYIYETCADADGVDTCVQNDFTVTPSGLNGMLGLYFILIGIVYGIAFFGFFGKNVWLSVFGGMGMILLGLFTLNNGIDIYRNFMTESFSWFSIGIGAFFALTASTELIEQNM